MEHEYGTEVMPKRRCLQTILWKFAAVRDVMPITPTVTKQFRLTSPDSAFYAFKPLFEGVTRERFIVVWLNSAKRVLGLEVVSEGLLDTASVHPREVFRGAIIATAVSVVLMHNHPSGNREASLEDVVVTRQLVEAGKILGIGVEDHVIFADDSYTSMLETGQL